MKSRTFIFVLISFAILLVNIIHSKNISLKEPENSFQIAHEEIFGKLEYGKVIFKHQKHILAMTKVKNKPEESVCIECHQRNEFGDFSFEFPKNLKIKTPEAIKNAYHSECLSCHQKLSSQRIKTGPEILSCRNCHKRENEKVEIKYPLFEFDFAIHDKHVNKLAKDCSLCHHVYDLEEKNRELALVYEKGMEQSCYYCHDFTKRKGPELTKISNVAKNKGLNMQKASHQLCLNCHLQKKYEGKDTGPTVCSKCHTGKYKTLDELKEIPRPAMEQPKTAFIKIEDSKMKGVPFKHDFHEKNNKTCRICHHETLRSCKECHDLKGKEEGRFVNIATAYHSINSEISCQGCHLKLVNKKECIGCHYFIPPVKAEFGNREICNRCHTDKEEAENSSSLKLKAEAKRQVSILSKIKEEVVIKHLEKEFEPVNMPHGKMIRRLNEIISPSRLATYFHGDSDTLCRGCHHKSKENAEAEKEKPPLCVSCHSAEFGIKDMTRLRLQSAYHGMCIKCHETIGLEKPKKCNECHERKVKKNVHN